MTPYERGYDVVIVGVCTGMSEMFEVLTIHKHTRCVCICVLRYCMFDVDIFAPSHVGSTALNFTLLDCLQIYTRRVTSISGFFSFSFAAFAPASQESNELTNHTEKEKRKGEN